MVGIDDVRSENEAMSDDGPTVFEVLEMVLKPNRSQ